MIDGYIDTGEITMSWKNILKNKDSFRGCGCEGETSNIESVEKVAGAVSTGAVAHSHLFKPRYGKKKKRCKKCRK